MHNAAVNWEMSVPAQKPASVTARTAAASRINIMANKQQSPLEILQKRQFLPRVVLQVISNHSPWTSRDVPPQGTQG
jgi:hypothetical protein